MLPSFCLNGQVFTANYQITPLLVLELPWTIWKGMGHLRTRTLLEQPQERSHLDISLLCLVPGQSTTQPSWARRCRGAYTAPHPAPQSRACSTPLTLSWSPNSSMPGRANCQQSSIIFEPRTSNSPPQRAFPQRSVSVRSASKRGQGLVPR